MGGKKKKVQVVNPIRFHKSDNAETNENNILRSTDQYPHSHWLTISNLCEEPCGCHTKYFSYPWGPDYLKHRNTAWHAYLCCGCVILVTDKLDNAKTLVCERHTDDQLRIILTTYSSYNNPGQPKAEEDLPGLIDKALTAKPNNTTTTATPTKISNTSTDTTTIHTTTTATTATTSTNISNTITTTPATTITTTKKKKKKKKTIATTTNTTSNTNTPTIKTTATMHPFTIRHYTTTTTTTTTKKYTSTATAIAPQNTPSALKVPATTITTPHTTTAATDMDVAPTSEGNPGGSISGISAIIPLNLENMNLELVSDVDRLHCQSADTTTTSTTTTPTTIADTTEVSTPNTTSTTSKTTKLQNTIPNQNTATTTITNLHIATVATGMDAAPASETNPGGSISGTSAIIPLNLENMNPELVSDGDHIHCQRADTTATSTTTTPTTIADTTTISTPNTSTSTTSKTTEPQNTTPNLNTNTTTITNLHIATVATGMDAAPASEGNPGGSISGTSAIIPLNLENMNPGLVSDGDRLHCQRANKTATTPTTITTASTPTTTRHTKTTALPLPNISLNITSTSNTTNNEITTGETQAPHSAPTYKIRFITSILPKFVLRILTPITPLYSTCTVHSIATTPRQNTPSHQQPSLSLARTWQLPSPVKQQPPYHRPTPTAPKSFISTPTHHARQYQQPAIPAPLATPLGHWPSHEHLRFLQRFHTTLSSLYCQMVSGFGVQHILATRARGVT